MGRGRRTPRCANRRTRRCDRALRAADRRRMARHRLIAPLGPQIRAKGLGYSYTGCDATLRVRADGEKFQQIVLNLLTNAYKFTERGGIELAVEAWDQHVLIRVSDTG